VDAIIEIANENSEIGICPYCVENNWSFKELNLRTVFLGT